MPYALQQTSVIATRGLKSGNRFAIDILSKDLKDINKANEWFAEFIKAQGSKVIAPGFQQVGGEAPGIRLLNFEGKWSQAKIDRLLDAAKVAADKVGVKIEGSHEFPVQIEESKK